MNYIDEIFERADIQHIREFLLHGAEGCRINKKPYHERLITAQKTATRFLRAFYDDNDEYEESTMPVFNYVTTVEEVYTEIGLKCGIILGMQIAANTKTLPNDER